MKSATAPHGTVWHKFLRAEVFSMAEKKTSGAAKPAQPDEEALAALAGWDCAEEMPFAVSFGGKYLR